MNYFIEIKILFLLLDFYFKASFTCFLFFHWGKQLKILYFKGIFYSF